MSDPKVKPSIAARELAMKIDAEWELVPDNGYYFGDAELKQAREDTVNEAALMCQSAMADLLERAERREWLLRRIMEDLPSKRDWLDPALEREAMDSTLAANIAPWKTTI